MGMSGNSGSDGISIGFDRIVRTPPQILAARTEVDPVPMEQNALLVKVFERVRKGYELDRVLADSDLSKKLVAEAHKTGIRADAVAINRRLQAIRKNSNFYRVKFKKFTRSPDLDPQPFSRRRNSVTSG